MKTLTGCLEEILEAAEEIPEPEPWEDEYETIKLLQKIRAEVKEALQLIRK